MKIFFLELQRIENKYQNLENYIIYKSIKKKIPIVATNENFFLNTKFYHTHDALLSISEQKYIDSDDRQKSHPRYFFKDYLTIKNEFKDLPFAIENTLLIAKKCTFFLDEKPTNLPKIFSDKKKENELLKLKSSKQITAYSQLRSPALKTSE